MQRFVITIVSLLSVLPLFAFGGNDWRVITSSAKDDYAYSVKVSTLSVKTSEVGRVATILGEEHNVRDRSSELTVWSVTESACVQGFGELTHAELDGTVKFTTDFARGGRNIGSAIAAFLCAHLEA